MHARPAAVNVAATLPLLLLSLSLSLSLSLAPAAAAASAADLEAHFATCLADPHCRAAYHQEPPSLAVFRSLYALGVDAPAGSPAAASAGLRARLAGVDVCPRNTRYVVDAAGVGACRCPDPDADTCGPVTPFHNVVVYVACAAGTAAILVHVLHHLTAHGDRSGGGVDALVAGKWRRRRPARPR